MSAHDVRVRTRHAGAYVRAAIVVLELGDDADEDAIANVVGSLAVLAGIAAADAITGRALGRRSASESHADAVDLLGSLEGDGLGPYAPPAAPSESRRPVQPSSYLDEARE